VNTDIKIDVTKDTASEAVLALVSLLNGRKLKDRVGYEAANLVKINLRSLPHNKQGWPPIGFYEDAARGTAYEVTDDGARITVDNENAKGAIKFAYNQGNEGRLTINSKGKLLTIPARQEFYGHSATEFTNLRYVRFASGAQAFVIGEGGVGRVNFGTGRESNVKGAGARSAMLVAYWLTDSVEQDARPEVLPSKEALAANVNHTVSTELGKFLAGDRRNN
jgi:hypothetical protein